MDKALFVSMTGAKHNLMAQAVHANNLANASTSGFRSELARAVTAPVYFGDGHPTRAYAVTTGTSTDFKAGPMIETGNDLDIAVKGPGFIAVEAPDGSEAYTRAGSFEVDSQGILRTVSGGMAVLGGGGVVAIPPAQKIQIASDGTIVFQGAGQGPAVIAAVDRIKLVNPDLQALYKRTDGLLVRRDGDTEPPAVEVKVTAGFIEGSNVNAVEAMTQMMSISRQFDMQLKLMRELDGLSDASSKLMRIS